MVLLKDEVTLRGHKSPYSSEQGPAVENDALTVLLLQVAGLALAGPAVWPA